MNKPKHTCPECVRSFSYPPSAAGRNVKCPACKKPIRLPPLPNSDVVQEPSRSKSPAIHQPVAEPVVASLAPASATQPCPFCAEPILAAAAKCKHCGEFLKQSTTESSGTSTASVIGILMAVVGGLIAAGAMNMDTSVSTGMGGRVHNIGLQQQQMMTLIFGLAVAAIGILIAVLKYTPMSGVPRDKSRSRSRNRFRMW